MRILLLFTTGLGLILAQANVPASSVAVVGTITSTILSTTSSILSTSTSTFTTSSCSTSTGTDGEPTSTCRSSFALQPIEVYAQAVVTITTLIPTTSYSMLFGSATSSQITLQSQDPATTSTSAVVIASSTYAYSTQAASDGSIAISEPATIGASGAIQSSTKTVASIATSPANASGSSPAAQPHNNSSISSGTTAAIIIAILLGLTICGAAVLCVLRKKKRALGGGSHGTPKLVFDAEKGPSISIDHTTGAALGKTEMCSETTALTHEAPPTPFTPRDGFPDDLHERYEMSSVPSRVHETDARPQYSPFPPRRGR